MYLYMYNAEIKSIDKIVYNGIEYTVVNKGSIMLIDGVLYDQLDTNLATINRKSIKKYLRDKYSLTDKEYYGMVVHLDPLYSHKCPVCGSITSFRGLTKGFYDMTCSKSHAQSLAAINGTHHFIKEFGSMSECAKIITKKRKDNGTHQFQDYKVRSRNHMSVFLNKGNESDQCCIYITEVPESDMIKLGITSDIDYRSKMNEISGFRYTNTEVILRSDRRTIAEMEMNLKIDLHDISVKGLEYFKLSDKQTIINYVKSRLND